MTLSILMSCMFLAGCGEKPNLLAGISDRVFEPELEYAGKLETVGQLAVAYLDNTIALRRANNKLNTICIAADRCEGNREGSTDE